MATSFICECLEKKLHILGDVITCPGAVVCCSQDHKMSEENREEVDRLIQSIMDLEQKIDVEEAAAGAAQNEIESIQSDRDLWDTDFDPFESLDFHDVSDDSEASGFPEDKEEENKIKVLSLCMSWTRLFQANIVNNCHFWVPFF